MRKGYRTVELTAAVDNKFPGEVTGFPEARAAALIKDGKAKAYAAKANPSAKAAADKPKASESKS